jgi:site-specific recombinase XerD
MDQYYNDFCSKMVIRNFSKSTQKSYQYELKKYLTYCEKELRQITSISFQDYLAGLIRIKKLSETSLKQSIGAVKFFLSTLLTFHTNSIESHFQNRK